MAVALLLPELPTLDSEEDKLNNDLFNKSELFFAITNISFIDFNLSVTVLIDFATCGFSLMLISEDTDPNCLLMSATIGFKFAGPRKLI